MKKEEKKLNLKEEEAKKEHTPEEQGCVELTDEQMAQVTGGASPGCAPPELGDLNVDWTVKGFDYTDTLITRY